MILNVFFRLFGGVGEGEGSGKRGGASGRERRRGRGRGRSGREGRGGRIKENKRQEGEGRRQGGGGDGSPLESMWSQLRRSREAAAAASLHQSAVPSPTSSFGRLLLH